MLIDDHLSNVILGVVYVCREGQNRKTDAFPVSVCISSAKMYVYFYVNVI